MLDKLRTIVVANALGRSVSLDQRGYDSPDLAGVGQPIHVYALVFPSVLVLYIEHAKYTAVHHSVVYEVPSPNVVADASPWLSYRRSH
jgi:hypothetical protein